VATERSIVRGTSWRRVVDRREKGPSDCLALLADCAGRDSCRGCYERRSGKPPGDERTTAHGSPTV